MSKNEQEQKINKQETASTRRPKKKLMDSRGALHCKEMPGFHLRWVAINDSRQPGNMQWAYDQGYEKVLPEEQGHMNDEFRTGATDIRHTGPDNITLVLMKQPLEYYEESLKELSEFNQKQVESAAKTKNLEAVGVDGKSVSIATSSQLTIK